MYGRNNTFVGFSECIIQAYFLKKYCTDLRWFPKRENEKHTMIAIGKFNFLKIKKLRGHEIYLAGDDSEDIQLTEKELPKGCQVGDKIEVFVFHDGKGVRVATLQKPLAKVDDVAYLKVVSLSHAGAFLDWGLTKDLLVPYSEQKNRMLEGHSYLVKVFVDESNRVAASMLLDDFILDEAPDLKQGEKVELMIADETEMGVKAVVNNQFWGVLYSNELFQNVSKGQKHVGFVKKVRSDNKIDLTLGVASYGEQVAAATDKILAKLKTQGGAIDVSDKSPPEMIYAAFGVSKKVFKQAVGALYKKRLIAIEKSGIKLIKLP